MKEFRNIRKDNFSSYHKQNHYCKHNVAITTDLHKVISYCTTCGKILDVKLINDFGPYGPNGEEGEILHD